MNSNKKFSKRAVSAIAAMALSVSTLGQSAALIGGNMVKAAETDNYAKLLQQSLFFYDANMCGKDVESAGLMQWRGNCHTSDEVPGGFHDAGDHAMFGLPQGFTASTIGWAYYEFKDSFDKVGTSAHFKTISDHFNSFFKASTKLSGDTVTSFLYQKEDGDADHAYWGAPENQTGTRKMYWTNSGASDIAAEYAASLALSYLNFGNTEDLKYAKALYDFSTKYNQVATDGPNGFYKSSGCQDEQAWAAGWLYMATKDEKYKNDCASKQVEYIGWIHGWDNVGLGAAMVYAEITNNWGKVNNWIGGKATGNGYFFLDKWGSARINASMQMTALIASKHSNADYTEWAKGQMDYLLGKNPANTCFVIGYADNSAKNPHHRAASGYANYDELGNNQQTSPNGHSLVGALVGGPSDQGGTYQDVISDYVCNEVACDYNAGLVGAAAGLYSVYKTGTAASAITGAKSNGIGGSVPGTPATSTPTSTPTSAPTSNPTSAPTSPSSSGGTVLLPSDMDVATEKGEDGEINNYAEFNPKGAKTATLYVKVNSNDTEISGAFGTWNGKWVQKDFEAVKVPSDKIVKVTYDIPSDVGNTVKAMVFWPHGTDVTIQKVVLDESGSASTPTSAPTAAPTVKPTSTPTTAPTSSVGANDIVLLPSDMNVDTELGDDKEINNFAEFRPQGASSATLYVKVNSNDTEISGAFGTWNGEWVQEDFEAVKVPSDKIVKVDYKIPAKVGSTVKAMIFWPHGDGVTIEKVVLHKDGAGSTPTAAPTVKPTTTPTATPTAKPTTAPTQAPSSVKGDTNTDGTVSTADVVTLMQALVGKKTLTGDAKNNADMNDDGRISILDLIMLKNLLLK